MAQKRTTDAINGFAARMEAPLTALYDKAVPQIGALVDQHVGAELNNMGVSTGGARLVVTAATFVLFLIVAAMIGLLRIGVQFLSLLLVARNSIKAIEGGYESDAKAILAYLCILASIEFIEKTPLSIILDAVPLFGIIKATFMLVCSTPSTGVAMKVYRALAEPYFGAGNVFSNSPSSSSTSMAPSAPLGFMCTVKSASGLPKGAPLYCMLSLAKGLDQAPLSGECFLTAANTQHKWAEALTLPFNPEATVLSIAIKEKQQFGSDSVVGTASVVLLNLGPEPTDMEVKATAKDGEQVVGILTVSMSLNK
jgi:hypothetical protein